MGVYDYVAIKIKIVRNPSADSWPVRSALPGGLNLKGKFYRVYPYFTARGLSVM